MLAVLVGFRESKGMAWTGSTDMDMVVALGWLARIAITNGNGNGNVVERTARQQRRGEKIAEIL